MSNIARLGAPASELPALPGGLGPQDDGGSISIREIVGMLRRHYLLICAITLLGTLLTAVWVSQLTPIYQAQAQVLVDPSRETITKFQPVVPGLATEYTMMETQAAIVRSRQLAGDAVRRLDLVNSPLYNPELAKPKPSLLESVLAPLTALFATVEAENDQRPIKIAPGSETDRKQLMDQIVSAYLGGLQVVPAQQARVLYVRFSSPDRELASRAANMAAEVYIRDQIANRGESTQSALRFLSEKVEQLRAKMLEAEHALADFRAKTGLMQEGDSSPLAQQLVSYRAQSVEASLTVSNLESSLQQVQRLQRADANLDSVGPVMNNPFIAQLRSQEVELNRKIAEARTQLRDNHPQLVALRNQLQEIRGKIAVEVHKVAANLGNDLQLARQRADSLKGEIGRLETQQAQQGESEVKLRELQLAAQTARSLYEAMLARFNEVNLTDDKVQKAEARVLDAATVPGSPVAPRKDIYITMAFLVSFALSVGLVMVIELLDSGFRSVHQLEQIAGTPALGMVPFQTSKLRRNKRPWDTVLEKPNSSFAEAIRTLRTGLLLSSVDHPPRSVLVTSSVPGEGKTTTALALAAAAAASGQRTIIVDCDMRQPSLHSNLGVGNNVGLSDHLTGNAPLEELIHIDDRSGLHYICAGRLPPSPTDLLSSQRMKQLLQQLSGAYQLTVLDTPPILAVSDALLLVRNTDKTIFVVRWERTRRDVALSGLKAVYDAGARVGGLALTQVNLRKHARYDYSDSGIYYYRGYKRYYVE